MATARIGKKKAFELISNSKGRFFSVTFIKQDKSERVMNASFKKQEVNPLGYINLRDIKLKEFRQVNLQTIKKLTIGKQNYRIG